MTTNELTEFCKINKPVSVEFDYGFKITFENGITIEADYYSDEWEIETNIEAEAARIKWEKKKEDEDAAKKEFADNRERIMHKFTPEQWAEIEQAFLYNNGMTFAQNKELQEQNQRFYTNIQEKYSNPNFTTMLDHLSNLKHPAT